MVITGQRRQSTKKLVIQSIHFTFINYMIYWFVRLLEQPVESNEP
jgi:hypothetical protein